MYDLRNMIGHERPYKPRQGRPIASAGIYAGASGLKRH
jgi:hypothetical protein